MAVTIVDIARYAGVSKSTVSRVLNESGPISEETKKKVLEAVKVLNYKPNEVARSLVLKRSKIVALIVQDIRNPYYAYACWYAERVFQKYGYSMVIYNADNDPDLEREVLETIKYRRVDGVLSIGGNRNATNVISFHSSEGTPFVLLDREIRGYDIPTIDMDNVYGGRIATEFLFSLGHRCIFFATSDFTVAEMHRLKGFADAFQQSGLEIPEDAVISQPERMWSKGVCPGLSERLERGDIPTAVFASNDFKALQVIRVLKKHRLSVPSDVSVIGYDDIDIAPVVIPSLTTIHQPLDKMIELGAKHLLNLVRKEHDETIHSVLKPWLVERESTRDITE